MPPAGCRAAGFTLIEMLVVIVVLGLALGLVLARGPMRSPTLDVRAAAGELAAALRLTRAHAIADNRSIRLVVDVARHRFAMDGGAAVRLPADIGLAVRTIAGDAAGPLAAIGFAPDGSSTGGQIALAEAGSRMLVGVDWLTGRVRVVPAPSMAGGNR
jgi:general secretion pathway protein H